MVADNRTQGRPSAGDDIADWLDGAGAVAVAVALLMICLGVLLASLG